MKSSIIELCFVLQRMLVTLADDVAVEHMDRL